MGSRHQLSWPVNHGVATTNRSACFGDLNGPIYENITLGPVTFEQIGLTVVELSDFDFSLSIIAEKQMARSKEPSGH